MYIRKAALAVGVGVVAAAAAVTITVPSQHASATTYYGGAGATYIQPPAPTPLVIPKARPTVMAQPFTRGQGNGGSGHGG